MLHEISKVSKAVSVEIKDIPFSIFIAGAAVLAVFLVIYRFILPRYGGDKHHICRYQRYCMDWLIAADLIFIFGAALLKTPLSGSSPYFNGLFEGIFYHNTDKAVSASFIVSFFMFLPMGIFTSCRWKDKKYNVVISAVLSAAAGTICQLISYFICKDMFDPNDILAAVIGGLAGAGAYWLWRYAFGRKTGPAWFFRVFLVLLLIFFVLSGTVFGAFHVLRIRGSRIQEKTISNTQISMRSEEQTQEEEEADLINDPDLIWHEGKAYRYNEKLTTVLVMGIDQSEAEIRQEQKISGKSGQADTIFLVVLDEQNSRMTIINMSRDTMTNIPLFDYTGNYIGEGKNHLGLAYAFGDGKDTSCQYMADAVSNLFYGMPINGYVALNMEAVTNINDAVGGVEVPVTEEVLPLFPLQNIGDMIKLEGTQTLKYLRERDTSILDSNSLRMRRQKQYVIEFIKQARKAIIENPGLPVDMYHKLSEKMVTDIGIDDAVYLGTQALEMSLTDGEIITLQGEARQGTVYDEFYVDDEALYDLVLRIFYNEENTGVIQ